MSTLEHEDIRLKRAHALVVDFDGRRFEVVNFLRRQSFRCNGVALEITTPLLTLSLESLLITSAS